MPTLLVSRKAIASNAMTARATMIPYHITVREPMVKATGFILIVSI